METRKSHFHSPKSKGQRQISEIEEAISRKLEPVINQLTSITEKFDNLNARFIKLQSDYEKVLNTKQVDSEEFYHEAMDRYRRRKFLILSGVAERSLGSVEERRSADTEIIREIAAELRIQVEPTEVARIGKIDQSRPRLLRFKCKNLERRSEFLRKGKELRRSRRFDKIFVNPDQTFLQRQKSKELRDQLKVRRKANEDVYIRHGKIVEGRPNEKEQNFH